MAKTILRSAELDKDVQRYLEKPVTLNDISEYSLSRDSAGTTWLTVKIWVNMDEFEKER